MSGEWTPGLMVSVNGAVRVIPPPTPIRVTMYEPTEVVGEVVIMQMLVNDGRSEGELSVVDAPAGSPDTERLTI